MFKYELEIGEYNAKTKARISLSIERGLAPEDYTAVREALQKIEDIITRLYEQEISALEAIPTQSKDSEEK